MSRSWDGVVIIRGWPLILIGLATSCGVQAEGEPACVGLDEGCLCEGDRELPCYLAPPTEDDDVLCYRGVRRCRGGTWGDCEDLRLADTQAATGALISGPERCNICNPACFRSSDRPTGRDLTPENSDNVEEGPGGIVPGGMATPGSGDVGPWEPTVDTTTPVDPCRPSTLSFHNTGRDQDFTVPADTRFIRIKAWGGGGNHNGNRDRRGGAGGYSEGLFRVAPGEVFEEGSRHTVVAGDSAHCGGGWWRYGVGVRTGAGFSGVLRDRGGWWVDDWRRAIVIAGGGGGAARDSPSGGRLGHGHPGNAVSPGLAANMGGLFGGDRCGGSGGGGYRGGRGGGRRAPGFGGSGFVAASAVSQQILSASYGSWDPPNTRDPDYQSGWGRSEDDGGVSVNFLCFQPCRLSSDCVEAGYTCERGTCQPPPPPPPMGGAGDPLDDAEGLSVDPSGAIVLTPGTSDALDAIWIANTGEGSISRFDVRSFREVGRYITGPYGGSGGRWGGGNDPSRTSINTAGHAFVAGRGSALLLRISPDGINCPDTNGDGIVTTSTSGMMLPWQRDDCVLWATDMTPHFPSRWMRAVAAQDLIDPATGDVREYVWVGGYNNQRIALVDGADGRVLMSTNVGASPYGFALDASGNLWISTLSSNRLVRVDTNRCNERGCTSAICVESSPTGRSCDSAVKQSIPDPFSGRPYGITVDFRQRVWLGNYGGDGSVWRYDPSDNRWRSASVGDWSHRAGIAADSMGNVWTTGPSGALRINADNPSIFHQFNGNAYRGWGVAIDVLDRAWIIDRWGNRAHVATPGGTISNASWVDTAFSIREPYTYSDMTGQQLRLAASPRGTYRHVFEGCSSRSTVWDRLEFMAETPAMTFITFRARTAATRATLAGQPWVALGATPASPSPLDIGVALTAAGITPQQFLEIEVTLVSTNMDPAVYITPRLIGLTALHSCSDLMPGSYQRTYDSNDGCFVPRERPDWDNFHYITDVPTSTSIRFDIYAGETVADVTSGSPALRISIPPAREEDTLDLTEMFAAAGFLSFPTFVRIQATLMPDTASGAVPTLAGWDLDYTCVPME